MSIGLGLECLGPVGSDGTGCFLNSCERSEGSYTVVQRSFRKSTLHWLQLPTLFIVACPRDTMVLNVKTSWLCPSLGKLHVHDFT